MNNIKKTGLGLLVAALAIGFSAFTQKRSGNTYRFYKADMTYSGASDYRGYKYYADDRCATTGPLCSALWDIGPGPAPSDGDELSSSSVYIGNSDPGHYVE